MFPRLASQQFRRCISTTVSRSKLQNKNVLSTAKPCLQMMTKRNGMNEASFLDYQGTELNDKRIWGYGLSFAFLFPVSLLAGYCWYCMDELYIITHPKGVHGKVFTEEDFAAKSEEEE